MVLFCGLMRKGELEDRKLITVLSVANLPITSSPAIVYILHPIRDESFTFQYFIY